MRRLILILCCLPFSVKAAEQALQPCLSFARQQAEKKAVLAKDCPALFNELQEQQLPATFVPPLKDEVSLAQLEFLADSQHQLRTSSSIQQNGLDQLLAGILEIEAKDPQAEWWQAFLKWLDSFKAGDYEAEYQWLIRFMQVIKPSGQAVRFFIYGSIALLVVTSVWMVIREFYLAGFFVRLTGKRKPLAKHQNSKNRILQSSTSHQAVNELPPRRQIAVLLEKVIDTLAERNVIPSDATLTHRQIARFTKQHTADSEPAFANLVQVAEPILYGDRTVGAQVLSDYWRDAQALLGRRLS